MWEAPDEVPRLEWTSEAFGKAANRNPGGSLLISRGLSIAVFFVVEDLTFNVFLLSCMINSL